MKQLLMLIVAAALIMGVGAGVTHAYLTAEDTAVNELHASGVEISIEEEFEPPGELKPGQKIKKSPRIVSSSDIDCYVRMRICFTDSQAQQVCEPLAIREGWQLREDGYYYWLEKLRPGQATAPLFDTVQIRGDVQEIPPFDLLVYAEAVQCGGLSAEEAWKTMNEKEKMR